MASPWSTNQQQTKSSSLVLWSAAHGHDGDEFHNHSNNEDDFSSNNNNNNNAIHYFLESHSPPDDERRPTRIISKNKTHSSSKQHHHHPEKKRGKLSIKESKFQDWGVQLVSSSNEQDESNDYYKFPESLYALARQASDAIRGTLYQQNKLDPNIVSNAMRTSRFDYRPLAFAAADPPGRDIGRLGIELDGLRYLLFPKLKHRDLLQSYKLENRAMIRVSLYMAGMLSRYSWMEEIDDETYWNNNNNNDDHESSGRPIAMYFNSLGQALMASQELRLLKEVQSQQYSQTHLDTNDSMNNPPHHYQIPMFDNIRILCLGQDDIPEDMTQNYNDKKGRRKWGTSSDIRDGKVKPQNGLMMIVQPTDYSFQQGSNNHDVIATPLAGGSTLQSLQSLLAKASIHQLPTVVLSPRLTEQHDLDSDTSSRMPTRHGGTEQSFYQKSSTYGGIEPPKGPTPWLLRDFIPPIFSFIGCALEFPNNVSSELDANFSIYSRVAMMQSIMDIQHPWHIFAVEEQYRLQEPFDAPKNTKPQKIRLKNKYHYMGNTKTSSGRPTRDIMQEIFREWYTFSED